MKRIFVMERPYKALVMAMAIATYGHILWDNTVDTAQNMGSLGPIQIFEDWVGSSDRYDYYQFSFNLNLGTYYARISNRYFPDGTEKTFKNADELVDFKVTL